MMQTQKIKAQSKTPSRSSRQISLKKTNTNKRKRYSHFFPFSVIHKKQKGKKKTKTTQQKNSISTFPPLPATKKKSHQD